MFVSERYKKQIADKYMINIKEIKTMKTTTSIKILTVTLVLLVVGDILSMLTIKNYNLFDGSFLTAVCCNVCILCCELEKKKKEDAEAKNASANIEIR